MVRSLVARSRPLRALLATLTLPLFLAAPSRAAWDAGGTLVAEPNSILAPSFASNGSGGVYAFWTAGFTQMPGTMVLGDGTHPAAWPLAGTEFMAGTRQVSWTVSAPDGEGGAYVAASQVFVSWPGTRPHVIGRVLADATRAPGWPDTGLVVADTPHAKVLSRLFPDGAGGAFLVWLDGLDFGMRFGSAPQYAGVHEVRALRIVPGGTLAPGWPAAGVAVTTAPPGAAWTGHFALEAVADGGGGVFMAWADSLDGVGDVYVQRLDGTGAIASGWPVGGRAVGATSRQRFLADLILDGTGGVLVSWSEYGPPTNQSLVTRIDGAGATASGWPADGVPLCPTCGDYATAGPLVTDGAGGALVGFQDIRLPGMEDLFITRVLGDGVLDGPTGGMPIATTADGEVFQDAVSDGAQGGYFLWMKRGSAWPPQDALYATHVTATFQFASGWPAEGLLVSDRPGWLLELATLLPDGAGGATVAWILRPEVGPSAVYAYRLPNVNADVPPLVMSDGAVLALAPNPSAGATRIALALPRAGEVSLDVFDVSGRRVRALASGSLAAGTHTRAWDGRDDAGAVVPAGLYLVRARGEGLDATARVVRVR